MGMDNSRKVLLIEDEPNIAEAIQFILSRAGWEVIHHAEGRDAALMARQLRPRLVILDHMLPGLSGLEVLTALRADPATAAVPVLMLTAKGLPRDREAAERAGATRFMTKPFSNAEIVAEVGSLTGTGTAADSGSAAAGAGAVGQAGEGGAGTGVSSVGISSAGVPETGVSETGAAANGAAGFRVAGTGGAGISGAEVPFEGRSIPGVNVSEMGVSTVAGSDGGKE